MNKKKLKCTQRCFAIFVCIFYCMYLFALEVTAQSPEVKLYAKSALLMDADNNRVLYEKNGYEIMPMASTTKIMTCIIALEYGNLEDEVLVSSYAASMPKVHLGMIKDQKFKLKDLLFSLMLESHNDTAVAIAEHIGGSVEGFAELMNQKARDLGCENTYFITPNGLDATKDDKVHSTTAYDLAKIASYAIKNPLFIALVGTKNYSFHDISGKRSYQVNNKDAFLDLMNGAIGIKTGFTNGAGYCFVGGLKDGDRTLVSVVLACGWPPNKSYKWQDTKSLMNIGLENYQKQVLPQEAIPETLSVVNGVEDKVSLICESEETKLLLSEWDQVSTKNTLKESVDAPVKVGDVLGEKNVYVNGEVYRSFPIKAGNTILEYTFTYCLTNIIYQYLGTN